MDQVITTVRRALWLVLFGAIGGAVWVWRRDRNAPPMPPTPPEWPPLNAPSPAAPSPTGVRDTTTGSTSVTPANTTITTTGTSDGNDVDHDATSEPTSGTSTGAAAPKETTNSAATIHAVVDEPAVRSAAGSRHWMAPLADGTCPISHPVKANVKSGIFHIPGGRFYQRTSAERCYATAEEAIADGYRQAKA